jgi:hypothetical protein
MNKPGQGMPDHDEREWQVQERALREARDGLDMSSDDIALAQYRSIALALRQPPHGVLPADFAAGVARFAGEGIASERAAARVDGVVFEQVLVRILSAAFALSALAALGIYGGRLLAMLQSATGNEGLQWTLALAACVGLSWSLEWLRRRSGHGHDGPMRAA